MKDISLENANDFGIENKHSIMENGEKRFRLLCKSDKTAYIRAEGGNTGYWQKSHYHKTIKELYIIQKGSILVAEYINDKLEIKKINENEFFSLEPNIPHNIYMYPNTITHTVKYGKIDDYDWIPCGKLDKILKNINIKEYQKN